MWTSSVLSELWWPSLRSLGSWKSLNGWTSSHWPSIKRLLLTMRTGFYTWAASTAWHLYLWGGGGVGSVTKIWGQEGTLRYGIMPSQATSGEASGTWPIGSSKPWRGWKWQKRTKMGAANWHFSDRLGQNHRTSSICQEALEPMMLGYKLPHSLKNTTNDKNPVIVMQ